MPPGRTGGGYTAPTLTEEEAAALAAEQAAAYGSDYAPAEPPPAAPVQPPPATAVASEQYAPAPPPAEPYTSISPQVIDTSNPAVEPGYSAPPSERRDSYTAVNQAHQPAEPWTSISPQDAGNASRTAYPVSVSDFRDPLKTPEATMAQDTRYSPADPGRQNTQDFRSAFGDNLGRSVGLDPNNPRLDMANQLTGNFFADTGDALGVAIRNTGGIAAKAMGNRLSDVLRSGFGAKNSLNDIWHATQDVTGPLGMLPRQIQSTTDDEGAAIRSAFEDRKQKTAEGAGDVLDRAANAVPDAPGTSPSVDEILSFPLPTFGMDTPEPPDVSENPDATWALHPGLVAQGWGWEKGKEARDWLGNFINATPAPEPAPYDPLSSAYVPRSPERTNYNWDAAEPYGTSDRAIDKNGAVLGPQRLYDPPPLSSELPAFGAALPLQSAYDPLSSAYVPRDPVAHDPGVLDRAREAATAAKSWASGLDMPDINLPDVSLPGGGYQPAVPDEPFIVRRSPAGPAIDPNAMYMPEAPPPTLLDQVRGATSGLTERIPDVNLPGAALPDVSLPAITLPGGGEPTPGGGPGTGGSSAGATATNDPLQAVFEGQDAAASAVRSTTQPEGTSVAQEAGANWIKDANGAYVGIVDPSTGEYVMLPAGASNEEKQAIVDGILAASTANAAPGPSTAAPATAETGTGSGTTPSTSSGSTTGGSGGNGAGGGSTTSGAPTDRKSRSSDYVDDYDDDAPLRLEDFIQDFDGDGVIGKRDRMQGKQAFEQAKAARSKKRRGKTTTRKNSTNQFPFNREPSPIRKQVLGAIAESQGRA